MGSASRTAGRNRAHVALAMAAPLFALAVSVTVWQVTRGDRAGEGVRAAAGAAPEGPGETADLVAERLASEGERTSVPGAPGPAAAYDEAAWAAFVADLDASQVRGRAVFAGTSEPASHVELRVLGVDPRGYTHFEFVETDAHGFFATSTAYGAGAVSARARTGRWGLRLRDRAHRHLVDGRAHPWLLEVECNTSFALDLHGPLHVERYAYEARLIERHRDGYERAWHWSPVGEGAAGRVHFPLGEFEPHEAYDVRIEVRSKDGMWRGSADVDANTGIHVEPVRVDLEASRVAVIGRVVNGRGAPAAGVNVLLMPASSERTVEELALTDNAPRTAEDGTFRLEEPSAGAFRFVVAPRNAAGFEADLDLALGELDLGEVVLHSLGGGVTGLLLCEDGTPPNVRIALEPLSGQRAVDPREIREWRGEAAPFRFSDVESGTWELVCAPEDEVSFVPIRLIVHPPAEGLTIEVPAAR